MKKIIVSILILASVFLVSCAGGGSNKDSLKHLNAAYEKLLESRDFNNLSEDFSFPNTILVGENDEIVVSVGAVKSNSSNIVTNDKSVSLFKDNEDHAITLSFPLTYDEVSLDYHITAVLRANLESLPKDPWEEIQTAIDESVPNPKLVSSNIDLIKKVSKPNVIVNWLSSKPSVISPLGVVTANFANQEVVLTAYVDDGGRISSKNYTFIVAKKSYEVTNYVPYEYYDGGGEGIYADPLMLLNDQMMAFNNSSLRVGIPSYGNNRNDQADINVIVVPIEFTDDKFTAAELDKVEKGFFGTSEETGWESVSTYYNKSSFGKVDYKGIVLDPYDMGISTSQFQKDVNANYAGYEAAKQSYDHVVSQIDNFDMYDYNKDGYLDGIYFVYSRPYTSEWGGLWWAHKSTYYAGYESYPDIVYNPGATNEIRPNVYMWASHTFFDEGPEDIPIMAETFIHETGHLFGLPDYYDYDTEVGLGGGLGGADMMDQNYGDHGPFNKLMLGWIKPQIVTESITVKVNKATATGNVLLIPFHWKHSLFSEYLLVDYYTPDGLYDYGVKASFHSPGVRVYHVDATLGHPFLYNNSYTSTKLISYISAGGRDTNSDKYKANANDLFHNGSKYNWDNFQWHTLGTRNPKVQVVVQEETADYAVISVQYTV